MKQTFNITRGLILAAMLGLMVVAGLGMQAQQADTAGLERASQENLYWNVAQVEVELARFLTVLAQYQDAKYRPAADAEPPAIGADTVNDRFNILWSRADVFRAGRIGQRMREIDTEGRIDALFRLLEENDAKITNIDGLSRSELSETIAAFVAFGRELRDLTNVVVRAEERRFADFRSMVRQSSRLTLFASFGAIALAVLLIAVMLYETRRYRIMAEESAALARAAEAAARSKSRFLTMMSHELRTPMNGVLGMLELVRQTPLNEPQQRLIEQAQRSGTQMIGLLGDILDLSDLQDERIEARLEAFSPAALADSLESMLAAEVQRGGLALAISIADGTPDRLEGDLGRLRQIIRHITGYLVDVVGSQRIDIALGWKAGRLRVEVVTVARAPGEAGWQPSDMFQRGEGDYGNFASDALGPMIARGLCAAIGGEITLDSRAEDRIAVVISVPARDAPLVRPALRLDVETGTLALVLRGICGQIGWQVTTADDGPLPVAAIAVETGTGDDRARVSELRRQFPGARMVGIGMPMKPELFDAVCALPPSAAAFRAALEPQADSQRAVS